MSKISFCENTLKEVQNTMETLSLLRTFLEILIREEESGGYMGDGMNDPENVPNRIESMSSIEFYNKFVKPSLLKLEKSQCVSLDVTTILKALGYGQLKTEPTKPTHKTSEESGNPRLRVKVIRVRTNSPFSNTRHIVKPCFVVPIESQNSMNYSLNEVFLELTQIIEKLSALAKEG